MTTTGEDTRPLPLIGQAVGQAQASLTRLLTGILAGTGTSYLLWLGLQRLNALGGQPTREAYEADLSYWLQLDGPAAARLAGDVVAAGLAASDGDGLIALSAQGRALREAGPRRVRSGHRADAGHHRPRRPGHHHPDPGGDHQAGPGDEHHGGKPMTTQNLPGTDAARHGTGDADLTIMLAAHDAFRRDLTRLVRAAAAADLSDPARRRSVEAGWELFKRELHLHHTAEDEVIWPVLRPRLAHSENALSVLDAMEEEHERIDPLLAAVDAAFAQRGEDSLADVIDALVSTLTGHLAHEERDGLPLIGVALTAAEWRGVGFKIARRNGLSEGGEMFAWMLDGAAGDAAATLRTLPPPLRLLYRAVWKPRFNKTPRW